MATRVKPESLSDVLSRLEISLDEFAQHVGMIADGMKVLTNSKLQFHTIILLVSRSSGLRQQDVTKVLEALSALDKKYLKPLKT